MIKKWKIDEDHSQINFSVDFMGVNTIIGSLQKFQGTLELVEEDDFTKSKFHFQGLACSAFTDDSEQDSRVCFSDFFDIKNHSLIQFLGNKIEKIDDSHYFIVGELNIKGFKKKIILTAHFNGKQKSIDNSESLNFEITGLVQRSDFDRNWNRFDRDGIRIIDEHVQIHIQLQLKAKTD
ncbi:YceI family protein [uncultured Aquimarina sp.]|uniref:YceI family protein n=1 Tax=uncultured Aquimarina sp. TaxID=575652 RepID=UPI0026163066|nr:YceI family protein [uncultured Aquimarina sp.]